MRTLSWSFLLEIFEFFCAAIFLDRFWQMIQKQSLSSIQWKSYSGTFLKILRKNLPRGILDFPGKDKFI